MKRKPSKQEIEFASRIKELRLNLGYSLRSVATKIGISQVVLYNYKTLSSTKYSISLIEKIAEIYKVTPACLCGWENNDTYKISEIHKSFVQKEIIRNALFQDIEELKQFIRSQRKSKNIIINSWKEQSRYIEKLLHLLSEEEILKK